MSEDLPPIKFGPIGTGATGVVTAEQLREVAEMAEAYFGEYGYDPNDEGHPAIEAVRAFADWLAT